MAKIGGKPLLEHLVNHLNKQGINNIAVNIHENFMPLLDYFGTRLVYFYEPALMGEYNTEKIAQDWLGDEYVVMNGDTLTNIDISLLKEARQYDNYQRVLFYTSAGRYAGTTYVNKKGKGSAKAYINGCYYFDIGDKKRLKKAREFYNESK